MKIFLGTIAVAAALGAFAFFGLTPFKQVIVKTFGTTTQGSTGQTARQYNVYGVNLAAPGANATSTSITNNSGNDLFITGIKVACESVGSSNTAYSGSGLSALKLTIGTTSTAAPAAASSVPLGGITYTIGTSTSVFAYSTSTVAFGAGSATSTVLWGAGQIETFSTNATNTAVCTFGLDVTSS